MYRSRSRDSCRECGFGAQLNCDDCRKFTVDWLALSMTRLPSRDIRSVQHRIVQFREPTEGGFFDDGFGEAGVHSISPQSAPNLRS